MKSTNSLLSKTVVRTFCALALSFAAVLAFGSSARAAVIANYNTDFWGGGTWNTGWSYQWNDGAIGTASNYKNLSYWWGAGAAYLNSGTYPDPTAGYAAAGHGPSGGYSSPGSTAIFSIAGYQVQTGQDGIGSLTSSSMYIPYAGPGFSDGVVVNVYVNDTLKGTVPVTTINGSFNMSLGTLAVGDRVYVAVGSGSTLDYDSFQVNYSIPDPRVIF
ncbi:MAG: hypothetical protein WCH98_14230 [Verrucomicrobiota bacterium]